MVEKRGTKLTMMFDTLRPVKPGQAFVEWQMP